MFFRLLFVFLLAAIRMVAGPALPIAFVPNAGQVDPSVQYVVQTPDLRAGFRPTGAVFQIAGEQIQVRFRNAEAGVRIEGQKPQSGKANFFLGRQAFTDLSLFSEISYRDLYPGIDLAYAAQGSRIKWEFVVSSGANPNQIQWAYPDAEIAVQGDGSLLVHKGSATLREDPLVIYQTAQDGSRLAVTGRYHVDHGTVGIELGTYDPELPLVVDPTVSYSTYLGGTGQGAVTGVAVDSSGNLYAAGWTEALNFPIAGALYGSNRGGVDAFIAKFNPAGTMLLFATYIGGNGDDRSAGIAVSSTGEVYVAGSTASTNFPVVAAAKSVIGGARDAFMLKLNAVGNSILYSTYWGGTNWDVATGISLDNTGNAYVCGDTASANFPVSNAAQSSLAGGIDAFAVKLATAGSVVYSTFLGGLADEHASGIAAGSSGLSHIVGWTQSNNFPTSNAAQGTNGGGQDAFVTKLSSGGSISFSTYLGGSSGAAGNAEQANAVAVSPTGEIYLAGVTSSVNFPVTSSVLQTANLGGQDAFVTKLSSAGAISYSTFLGGTYFDWANGIAVDSSGNAHVAGYTSSYGFPSAGAVQSSLNGGYDAFVTKLNSLGTAASFSTYYGGTGLDVANSIALDPSGNIYVGGQTASTDFPLTTTLQSSNSGGSIGWVAKFQVVAPPPSVPAVVSVTPSSGTGNSVIFTATFTHPSGAASITSLGILLNTTASPAFGCYISYQTSTALFKLWDDAGTSGTTQQPGGSNVQNGQCTFVGTQSSVSSSGNTVTMTVGLIFRSGFTGAKTVYLSASDSTVTTGWINKGTWTATIPAPQPSVNSVSPNANSGPGDTFTFTFSDTQDTSNLSAMAMLFNSSLSMTSGCYVVYDRTAGSIALVWTNGGGSDSRPLGGTMALQNSNCAIGSASVTLAGLSLQLTVTISFKGAFSGQKNIYMYASEGAVNTGWVQTGTYNVLAGGLPHADSAVPGSGSGSSQRFSFAVSDFGGQSYIKGVAMLISPTLSTTDACSLVYDRTANVISLGYDNPANGATPVVPGANAIATNSQCSLRAANSTVIFGTTSLVVTVDLLFNATFSGTKSVFLLASEAATNTGWNLVGSFTVTGGAPTADSITPSSGSGSYVNFYGVISDSTSEANVTGASFLITTGSPANTANACYVVYNRVTSTIGLYNDAASTLNTKGVGSSTTLQNSQCAVGYSVMTVSGSSLTVQVELIFKAAFSGTKSVYLMSQEPFTNSGWVLRGSWTVP